jgi:ATP-dependent protease Clp ATPase subunit
MRLIRAGEQINCTFCKKSQQVARWLIASPDKSTYICDECTVEPSRLKLKADKREARGDVSPAPSSRVSRFLGKHLATKRMRCSFCRKRLRSVDSYVPAEGCETQVQVCGNCLAVCRQILRDEAEKRSNSR